MNKQLAFPVRPPRIGLLDHALMFPDRLTVSRFEVLEQDKPWQVYRGDRMLKSFPTHAKAIEWAQRFAAGDRVVRRS